MKTITFTGGLGAQLISAAAYFHLRRLGELDTLAHFGYFSQSYHVATPGVANDISQWKWELDYFELPMERFDATEVPQGQCIADGIEKLRLGLAGLCVPEIAQHFPIGGEAIAYKQSLFGSESFACIHIRRGDYVNVATHLVADKAFVQAAKSVRKLVNNFLIVSDSPLSDYLIAQFGALGTKCITATGGGPHLTHSMMRLSDILICSNSQYSLTAGALRGAEGLTLYPSQHDGDPNSESNRFLNEIRDFQVITRF